MKILFIRQMKSRAVTGQRIAFIRYCLHGKWHFYISSMLMFSNNLRKALSLRLWFHFEWKSRHGPKVSTFDIMMKFRIILYITVYQDTPEIPSNRFSQKSKPDSRSYLFAIRYSVHVFMVAAFFVYKHFAFHVLFWIYLVRLFPVHTFL